MRRSDRRGARSGRKAKSAEANGPRSREAPRTYPHPVYGAIPLLVHRWTDGDGVERATWIFDPSYQPPLPPGAIRGNPNRQLGRGAFDPPRYFYVDLERRCVQCHQPFVFEAREQKHWYETLGFNFASGAIRCRACRRRRRSEKALHHAVDDAKRALAARADDPSAQLALAEAIVTLRARNGRGRVEEAIAAARAAERLLREQPPSSRALARYWEARAQALAGRDAKARAAFEAFLAIAGPRAHRKQIREAEAWLEGGGG